MKPLTENLSYMPVVLSLALLLILSIAPEARATTVTADVNATSIAQGVKADSDSKTSILLLLTTRDLSETSDDATAEADASVWTRFYSAPMQRAVPGRRAPAFLPPPPLSIAARFRTSATSGVHRTAR